MAETGVATGKEEACPQRAHLLEEPNVQNWEAGVQQVEKHQEPAFIQRLGGGGRGDVASGQPSDAKWPQADVLST